MSKKINNLDYQAYKAQRDINEGLRIIREGYVFHDDEDVAQQDVDTLGAEGTETSDVDFIDKGEFSSSDSDISAIRKLVFKAMEKCCDDVSSPKYNVMKKIWNLLDSIAKDADGKTEGEKE